jgi:putative membrane protein
MRGGWHPGYHPEALFGLTLLLVFVALVVVGIILLVRFTNRTSASPPRAGGPLLILEERFARGEIDEDEFKQRREILRGG